MKKNDLVLEIASRLGLPKVECEKVIDAFADVVTDALVDGDKVTIRGFLTFETSECKAREGYNPQTAGIDKNSKLLKEIYEICKENIKDS